MGFTRVQDNVFGVTMPIHIKVELLVNVIVAMHLDNPKGTCSRPEAQQVIAR